MPNDFSKRAILGSVYGAADEMARVGMGARATPKWSRRHTAISLSHPNSETREERMTITIKARTAALILALFCVLAGLALGQLTQAHSATATSSVSRCP